MIMKTKIIGRESQKEMIMDAVKAADSQFLAVYGRRRIGKTFLVKRMFKDEFTFKYTGVENINNRQQLEQFHRSMLEQGLPKCQRPKNWLEAFSLLKQLVAAKDGSADFNNKKIIFLDELPWIDAKGSDFIPALGHFWNDWAGWTDDIVLIICGSATSWMVNKVFKNKGGLYNRVTKQIELRPFTLHECELLADSLNLNWPRETIAETYMILGGVPYYWNMLDPAKSLVGNIDELFFSDNSKMDIEYNALFTSMFKYPGKYESVVSALTEKKKGMTASEISDKTGVAMSASLNTVINNLKLCGFIEEVAQPTKQRRGTIYQLRDHFILFYYEFILKKKAQANFWSTHHDTGLVAAWRGLAFERVCFQHVKQIQRALGISGVYCKIYSWSAKADAENGYPGMQVDMSIDRADGVVNLCEAKFSAKPYAISPEYLRELRLRQARYREEVAPKKAVHLTMITTYGVVDNAQKSSINSFIQLDDLFNS